MLLKDKSIQNKHTLQSRTRPIHIWLAVIMNLHDKWKITSLQMNINSINVANDIPTCMMIWEIYEATMIDTHLQDPKTYIIGGWPTSTADVKQSTKPYWTFGDVHNDWWIAMNAKWIMIPAQLQPKAVQHLHSNHMATERQDPGTRIPILDSNEQRHRSS